MNQSNFLSQFKFNIIAAIDQDKGLGKNNAIPWHLKGDIQYFKELTLKTQNPNNINALIMGRKTWDSLPQKFRPLPNRLNVILSRNLVLNQDYAITAESLDIALERIKNFAYKKIEDIFIIGGATVYKEAINHACSQTLYLTRVLGKFNCDTYFPDFQDKFQRKTVSRFFEDAGIKYSFEVYEKRAGVDQKIRKN
ncbi:MAG: dihydrofolate reductase [Candidatus Margulisiibacteriota bacterium]|jgi:dihydrofolate reductase